MLIVPALDILGGRCVRLRRGVFSESTTYAEDPAGVAAAFLDEGAARLHIVDLDAARGTPSEASTAAVRAVLRVVSERGAAAQLGGGIRTVEAARAWHELGATYVVIGTLAVREPELAESLCRSLPRVVVLALDVRRGAAQTDGWTAAGGPFLEHARRWSAWPAAGMLYTDAERDGMLAGPDVDGLAACIGAFNGPVLASGGISSLDDISACRDAGAAGVILGRALYEGRFRLHDVLQMAAGVGL